jgi:hypothetical protein
MIPNPGLNSDFNRYLGNLDLVLPRRTRRGDRGAQALERTIHEMEGLRNPAAEALKTFLIECERFRHHQFWVDEDHLNRHTGKCWLPLLVLGREWRAVVTSILGFDAPESLGWAKKILIKPASPEESTSLKISVRSVIENVSEAAHDRFVTTVKNRFETIESIYVAEAGRLEIRRGRTIEVKEDDFDSDHHPSSGGLPSWLEVLLELRAVEAVEFYYPLCPRAVPVAGDFVRSILVIPTCPVEWRQKESSNLDEVLQSMRDDLGVGPKAPIHVFLSAVQHEWFALLEAFVVGLQSSGVAKAAPLLESTTETHSQAEDFALRHLARCLTLPPDLELHSGTEYASIGNAFVPPDEEGKPSFPHPRVTGSPGEIGFRLIERLSDPLYVTAWAHHFKQLAQGVVSRISTSDASESGTAVTRKGADLEAAHSKASFQHLALFVLDSISKNLDMLISVEGEIATTKLRTESWRRAWEVSDSVSEDPVVPAIHQLVQLAVTHEDPSVRARSLSALVYFLKDEDVLPDSETFGSHDDHLVVSHVLVDPAIKAGISPEISTWAARTIQTADDSIPRPLQKHIVEAFECLATRVSELAGVPASGSIAKEAKGKKA